jgi:hypothetical protein
LKLQKTQGQGGYQLYLSPSATSSYRIKRKRQGKNKASVMKEYRHAHDLLGDAKRKEKKPELEASLQREDLAILAARDFSRLVVLALLLCSHCTEVCIMNELSPTFVRTLLETGDARGY